MSSNYMSTGNDAALIEELNMLRAIIDLLPVNIYAKDLQSRFLVSNIHVAQGMGCTPEQLKGKTDFDFFPKDMAQAF